MVKRNGYRIELAEIERGLLSHPHITEAAVIATKEASKAAITAFVNASEAFQFDVLEINQFLLQHLPAYFLPDHIQVIAELPHTSTQKIDYQALIEMC